MAGSVESGLPPEAARRPARTVHWGRAAGGCVAAGCGAVVLTVALVGGLLIWLLAPFYTVGKPWIEAAHASPDGRYVVYSEGRSAGLDLEARVTIVEAGEGEDPEELLPWSRLLPMDVDWVGEREFVIDLDDRTSAGHRKLIHRTWRDVRFTINRE